MLAVVFALSAAISLLSRPKEVSYVLRHDFSVEDPAFVASAHALANPSPVKGNRVTLLSNGNEFYPAMLAAIAGARRTANLEPVGADQAQTLSSTRRATSSATKFLYAVSIAAASKKILIANGYFVPDRDSIQLFADAA